MKLYDLTDEYLRLYELMCDPDSDAAQVQESMEIIEDELITKSENYARIMQNMKSESDALRKESNRLAAMAKSRDAGITRLKENMKLAMVTLGSNQISTSIGNWTLRNNPESVNILDEKAIPYDYLELVRTPVKSAIKDAIKNGVEVPGAELIRTQSAQFR